MCTQPLKILNPSKWLSHDAGQQLYLRVPCGHCLECRQRTQNEWRIRTYYECQDTINSGGYVLFDTLTYAPEFLPRLSEFIYTPLELDFSCFRSKDIQDFLKRLRTYLSRPLYEKGTKRLIRPAYPVADNLRFFVVSEYGTSERGTKRPHYHIFLFVRHSVVPPFVLSAAIGKCWSYGRTDGLPFKTRAYVRDHNTFDTLDIATKRCLMYVSKYVAKDFIYSDMVTKRLKSLMDYYFGDETGNAVMSDDNKNFLNLIKRFVLPFHRQSVNFGFSYIKEQGVDNLIERGTLVFNVNGLPSAFALFPSLKRKLFYNRRKDENGDIRWYLNNRGILYKELHYGDNLSNLQKMIDVYNLVHDDKLDFSAEYYLLNQYRLQPSAIDSSKVLDQLVSSNSVYEYNGLRNYAMLDRALFGKHNPVLTKRDFGSQRRGFQVLNKFRAFKHPQNLPSDGFIRFKDFEIYSLFDPEVERQSQLLYDWLAHDGASLLRAKKMLEKNKKKLKHLKLC